MYIGRGANTIALHIQHITISQQGQGQLNRLSDIHAGTFFPIMMETNKCTELLGQAQD